jgi:hypothetical protein
MTRDPEPFCPWIRNLLDPGSGMEKLESRIRNIRALYENLIPFMVVVYQSLQENPDPVLNFKNVQILLILSIQNVFRTYFNEI